MGCRVLAVREGARAYAGEDAAREAAPTEADLLDELGDEIAAPDGSAERPAGWPATRRWFR